MATDRSDPDPRPDPEPGPDPAHAPGKRHKGPPPEDALPPRRVAKGAKPVHHQPWIPTNGLVGRKRRSPRRG